MITRRGQSVVEFSLILPVLLFIILAVFDLGWALHGYLSINHQCGVAARLAAQRVTLVVQPTVKLFDTYTHTPQEQVRAAFDNARSSMTSGVTYNDFNTVGTASTSVIIEATYTMTFMNPLLSRAFEGASSASTSGPSILTLRARVQIPKE
ncbi:MAG: TadE family protein [Candidatus Ozemobacteraceae bacterium]